MSLKKFLSSLSLKIDNIRNISKSSKTLFICRTDLIGDYVATRHFIKTLKSSEKYKDYQFVLLGNLSWRDVALEFDSQYIDEFIWLNRPLYKYKGYRNKLQKYLSKRHFDVAFNPQYSRDFFSEENIKMVKAEQKYCLDGDNYNLSESLKIAYNKNYTRVFKTSKEKKSYFEKTNEFLESLLDTNCQPSGPCFDLVQERFKDIDFEWDEPYIVIFPFAGTAERLLDIDTYFNLAGYIYEKYGFVTYVAGSKTDFIPENKIKPYIKNICGKYKLSQLPYIFSKAKLVLSNDSCAVHLAKSVNDKVICFSSGKFMPDKTLHCLKKENIKAYYIEAPYKGCLTICPEALCNDILNKNYDYESNYYESSYPINGINSEHSKILIDKFLNV